MAKDEKHIIDRLFAEGLEGAEMPVGNDLWKGIAAEMETDRLRKKAAVAWMTAAASLLLLLGLSTWFFVSNSFRNAEADRFTIGEVISLPYQNAAPELDNTFAQRGTNARGNNARGTNARGNNARGTSARGNNARGTSARGNIGREFNRQGTMVDGSNQRGTTLPALSNAPRAGLDLSTFFIDQYGSRSFENNLLSRINPGNSNREVLDQDSNPSDKKNATIKESQLITQVSNGNKSIDGVETKDLQNGLVNTGLSGNELLENGLASVPLTMNDQQNPFPPNKQASQNYPLQERILIETVQPLASLVSQDDLDEIFRTNSRSEAVVASAFDFNPKVEESGPRSRWAFGGAFSPDYSFSTASPVQDQLNTSSRTVELQDPAEAAKSPSSLVTAFSTGLNLNYKVSDRVGVQSGLFYSNRKSTTTSDVSSFGKSLIINSDFSLNQLEIPLLLQYSIVKRDQLDYYVSSGVSANLLWNYNNTISNGAGQVAARVVSAEKHTLQPSQGNFVLRTGIRYSLFNKVSLNLEPGLRYGILTNKYAFTNGKPVSLSLSSGVNYHF